MSLLPFLLLTSLGAIAASRSRGRAAAGDRCRHRGVLASPSLAAAMIRPGQSIAIGTTGHRDDRVPARLPAPRGVAALLLAIVGEATERRRGAPAVALGILATSALALSLPDAADRRPCRDRRRVPSARSSRSSRTRGRTGATVGTRVLRATAVAGTMAIAATAWIGRDLSELAAQPIVFGLAYLAFALAVAIRFGAIPAHTWAARLTDAVPETTLPLVTAIAPAALAIVALAWADASVAPLALDLTSVRFVVLAVAIASIFLASIAALIQDDIEHVVGLRDRRRRGGRAAGRRGAGPGRLGAGPDRGSSRSSSPEVRSRRGRRRPGRRSGPAG